MRLELRDISKRFPGVLANDKISISADKGQVLGLLGENGAGKTTLMNILSGLYKPDSGEILIDGEQRVFGDPAAAIHAGVGMVHQHFMLVPVFDVVEAVALGAETVTGPLGTFNKAAARKRIVELSEQYKLNVNPDAKIESLPVGVRQRVEILKALYRQSDILVLDEPSAVLTPSETEELFGIIRSLTATGTTVIFITHKLDEVIEVADNIVVLRRGRVAGSADPKTTTRQELANLMVGRDVELIVPKGPAKPGAVVLSIKDLFVRDDRLEMAVKGLDLEVRAGEIVAVAGVQGNGQTELVEAITGLRVMDSGSIEIGGRSVAKASPREVSDMGVAHIPEDRGRDGLINYMSVAENYVLDTYHRDPYSRRGLLDLKAINDGAAQGVKDFDIRTPSIHTMAASLSGGNQQKVVVAREFSVPVQLVIAAQPTRGLDVGSIEYIHRRIVEQRDAGAAIVIISTELDEVLAVGDRIAVMFDGRIVGILEDDDATYENLGLLMGGAAFGEGSGRMKALKSLLRRALVPTLAVVTALLLGGVVIILTDFEHLSKIGTDPLAAIGGAIGGVINGYGAMLAGALGDPTRILAALQGGTERQIATAIRPLTETLVAATPLIFVGLAVAISFRTGMFNIGGDGQLVMGALGATTIAIALQTSGIPSLVILLLAIVAGTLTGAFWGFIAGFLKARTGAHEVITTIMLNYISFQVVLFALRGDFLRNPLAGGQPISRPMGAWVDVPPLIDLPAIRLDWGFIVALLMAVAVSWLLFRTTKGFELRAAGFNMTAARYAGMSAGGSMMLAMALSGGLAGMGGGFLVIGTVGQLPPAQDLSGGVGFNAIALALLASLRPSGVVAAALLFGALTTGGKVMGIQSGIPFDLLFFIIAMVIMFVAAPGLIRTIWRVKVAGPAPEVASVAPTAPAAPV